MSASTIVGWPIVVRLVHCGCVTPIALVSYGQPLSIQPTTERPSPVFACADACPPYAEVRLVRETRVQSPNACCTMVSDIDAPRSEEPALFIWYGTLPLQIGCDESIGVQAAAGLVTA